MITVTSANRDKVAKRLREGLTDLTVTQRQVLFLHVVEHRPLTEVAYTLGLPQHAADAISSASRIKLYEAAA